MLKNELPHLALSAPVNVTWEITRLCNAKCLHCLSSTRMAECQEELDFSECRAFIDQLLAAQVFQINIGGGEPFLRSDIWDIFAYCHQRQLVTCSSTNGSLIDKEAAQRLAKSPYHFLQISLDGPTEKVNDNIRGKGSFAIAISALENLIKANFPHLSINTVVTAANYKHIAELYQLASFYGAKLRLSRFRPSGGGVKMWEAYRLSQEQTIGLAEVLSAHTDILTGDSFFAITKEDRQHLGLNMCGAAKLTCAISPDGNFYPCAFLQQPPFLCGNIRRESFQKIWRQAPVLQMLRSLQVNACENCHRFDICHGGCPAIAWHIHQDLTLPDPTCIESAIKNKTHFLV
ncbi:MAG: mycofactocin radical SAM maturase [Firmicutes bacterium]|nr:mycofactocin radical SAM maturase [Bacillota bacterium]